jgi:hypothetical protein
MLVARILVCRSGIVAPGSKAVPCPVALTVAQMWADASAGAQTGVNPRLRLTMDDPVAISPLLLGGNLGLIGRSPQLLGCGGG